MLLVSFDSNQQAILRYIMKFLAPILLLAIPALAKTTESLAEGQFILFFKPILVELIHQNNQDAACPTIPKLPVVDDKKLTDPFRFVNGRRVRSERDFACRQREIKQLIQDFELGAKPGKPDKVTSTYENGTLTVTVTDKGRSASFNSAIQYPTTGKAPYPAIIGIGGSSVAKQDDVVYINFPNDAIASQQSTATRGVGKFYDIYGSNATAGSLMGWAWGVSRLVDVGFDTFLLSAFVVFIRKMLPRYLTKNLYRHSKTSQTLVSIPTGLLSPVVRETEKGLSLLEHLTTELPSHYHKRLEQEVMDVGG